MTFGHEYGAPDDSEFDRMYDVRDLPDFLFDKEHELDSKADEIMDELNPGDRIAIGCEYGHDRSCHVARMIEENYPGVKVTHRDYNKLYNEAPENDHASD